MYALNETLRASGLDSVPAGTSILVLGEPMTGMRRLAFEFLAAGGPEEGAVIITTESTASAAAEAYDEVAPDADGSRLRIVGASGEDSVGSVGIEVVSSPSDLTGIGMALDKSIESLTHEVDRIRLGMDSISTLLAYLDSESVYKFVHVLTTRMQSKEFCSVCTLNTALTDDQSVGMLKNPFDATVELREDGERTEFRVVGLPEASGEWLPLRG